MYVNMYIYNINISDRPADVNGNIRTHFISGFNLFYSKYI
jgi:hypothetical protein